MIEFESIVSAALALPPDRKRILIAHLAGIHADETSTPATAAALRRVADQLEAIGIPRMRDIVMTTAHRYGLSVRDLEGPSRRTNVVHARQEAMWLARAVMTKDGEHRFSFPHIGNVLGYRHHTTIMHGVKRHAERLAAQAHAEAA